MALLLGRKLTGFLLISLGETSILMLLLLRALRIVNSDHSPIIFKPKPPITSGRAFKYEAFWEDNDNYRTEVATGWNMSAHVDPWMNWECRVKACTSHVKQWHQKTFRNAPKEINRLKASCHYRPELG